MLRHRLRSTTGDTVGIDSRRVRDLCHAHFFLPIDPLQQTFAVDILDPSHRQVFRGHLISWHPTALGDGRYRARATIVSLGTEKTVSQRFLDLATFDTFADAAQRGHQAAIGWVEAELRDKAVVATWTAVSPVR